MISKVKINPTNSLQIFQILRFSTMMLIGVVFAKTGLTTSQIGLYETFLLIAGSLSFFWLSGLLMGFLPMVNKETIEIKSNVVFNVFMLIAGLSVLACLFLIFFEHLIAGFLLNKPAVPYLKYLILYILASSPASLVEYVYLIKEQAKKILIYGSLSFFLMFIAVIIPAILGFGIEYSIAGLIVSAFFRLGWMIVLLFRNAVFSFDWQFLKKHLDSSMPLIFSMLISGSAQYIDSFIVTSWFDTATFAVFRFGAREFPLVMLVANAFALAMLPGFTDPSKLEDNLQKIRLNAHKMSNWMFPLTAVLMLLSHWAFPVVFNVDFAQSASVFNIYLLLIISRLMFPQVILIGLQKTNLIMWASFLEIVVNVAASLILVRIFGLVGVAYGTFLAYLFEKIFLMVFVSRNYHIKVSSYMNVIPHLVYSLLLAAEFVFIEYLI